MPPGLAATLDVIDGDEAGSATSGYCVDQCPSFLRGSTGTMGAPTCAPRCQDGQQLLSNGTCSSSACARGLAIDLVTRQCSRVCGSGTVLPLGAYQNASHCRSTCPLGQVLGDAEARVCAPACPPGLFFNPTGSRLDCTPRCPAGTSADLVSRTCLPVCPDGQSMPATATNGTFADCVGRTECPAGSSYAAATRGCNFNC